MITFCYANPESVDTTHDYLRWVYIVNLKKKKSIALIVHYLTVVVNNK